MRACRPSLWPLCREPLADWSVSLWTATDASNNTASAWMRLSIRDTTPPVFAGVANLTLSFSDGAAPWAN